MPTFKFTSPEGKTYQVDGPDGATQDQAFQILQNQLKTQQAPAPAPALAPKSGVDEAVEGAADLAATAVGQIPYMTARGLEYLGRLIFTRGDPNQHSISDAVPQAHLGAAGNQLLSDVGNSAVMHPAVQVASELHNEASQADQWLQQNAPTLHKALHGGLDTAGAIAGVAGGLNAAKGVKSLLSPSDATPAVTALVEPKSPVVPQYVSTQGRPTGTVLAGDTAGPALTSHNQQLANTKLSAEAGVDPKVGPLNTLQQDGTRLVDQGMQAPGAVYDRAGVALPTVPFNDTVTGKINAAANPTNHVVVPNPDVQKAIEAQRDALLKAPLKGPQVVDTTKKLRSDGYAGIASDDVSQQQIGRAKIQMADALDQHIEENLPANADVSVDQLRAARTAYAKNRAVAGALVGPDVNLAALARQYRASPNIMSGDLAEAAQFADAHPEVTALPSKNARLTADVPQSIADVSQGLGNHAGAYGAVTAIPRAIGRAVGRRMLLGRPGEQLDQAISDASGNVARLRQILAPIKGPQQMDLVGGLDLTPPPGSAAPPAPPAPQPLGEALAVGQGKASPGGGGGPSGPSDYGKGLVTPPAGPAPLGDALSVGQGKASPTRNPTPSGPSDYGKNLPEQSLSDLLTLFHGTDNPNIEQFQLPPKGQGVQMYGHGTYLASDPGTSKGYGSVVYKVGIPKVHADKMLDWNQKLADVNLPKGVTDQLDKIKEWVVNKYGPDVAIAQPNATVGDMVSLLEHSPLHASYEDGQAFTRDTLLNNGIPGIKFDDGGGGKNYAVFDPKMIKVLNKEVGGKLIP